MLLKRLEADVLAIRKTVANNPAATSEDVIRKDLLVTLYSDVLKVAKDDGDRAVTDDDVVTVARSYIKRQNEGLAKLAEKPADAKTDEFRARCAIERPVLEAYLPAMANEDDIKAVIASTVAGLAEKSPKHVGVVMKALTEKFGNAYDRAVASALAKAALA